MILAIVAGIIILLVILGSIGDDDGGDDNTSDGGKAARKLREGAKGGGDGKKALEPVGITVEPSAAVRVCLVGDGDEALIDAQMLAAGADESFDGFKTYRLDLPDGGELEVRSNGREESVDTDDKISYEADSNGIREIEYAGPDCP